jgi:hypothetical protein
MPQSAIIGKLKQLCLPSLIYFIIAILGFFISLIQTLLNKSGRYCVAFFSCKVPSLFVIFASKFIYILIWTWILNLLCKDGYTDIAWFLLVFPFVIFFIIFGIMSFARK